MSQLSQNLTVRRDALGMTVPEVHRAIARLGVDVAESTVYGWFNGSRGIRNMEHLKKLCLVLETSVDAVLGGEIEVAETPLDVTIVREMRELQPVQREAVLALIRTMKG